jgi:hypothetical protein
VHARRRILYLEWPERFHHWQKMCNYSKIFFRHNNWDVRQSGAPEAEIIIGKPSHIVGVQFLIEKDYYPHLPEHFINKLAVGVQKRKRPVALVTDFKLREDIVLLCNKRKVYPIFYKDLMKLDVIVPTKEQFRRL